MAKLNKFGGRDPKLAVDFDFECHCGEKTGNGKTFCPML